MRTHTSTSGLAHTPALASALTAHAHTPALTPERYAHTDVRYADPRPNACDGREHGRGMRTRVRGTSKLVVRRAHRDWRAYA